MNDEKIIWERYEEIRSSNYIEMYHGGMRWIEHPEIRKAKKGNYEAGNGIYFTNSYLTAKKYAKGGRVVQKVKINKNFKDITDVYVDLKELIDFVNSIPRMKRKKEIINDLTRNAERRNSNTISLDILNNLIVNHEAGSGNIGPIIANYFVQKGADASVERQSGKEFWIVVFNPKIILDVKVCPANIPVDEYMLN